MADVALKVFQYQLVGEDDHSLDDHTYCGGIIGDAVESAAHLGYATLEALNEDMAPVQILFVLRDRDTDLLDPIAERGGLYWNNAWVPYASVYALLPPDAREDFWPPSQEEVAQ
jgi:hypothetical protein